MSDKPYPFNADQLAWLHDLETTEDPQTKEWLHISADGYGGRKQGFCCLGRACVVLGVENINHDGIHVLYDDAETELPTSLTERLRLFSGQGTLKQAWGRSGIRLPALVTMNDEGNMTFKEIAAYIRSNPWNVFRDPEDAA